MGRPLSIIAVMFFASSLWGGEIDLTVRFDRTQLTFDKVDYGNITYDLISLSGCDFTTDIGRPMLPQYRAHAIIAPSARVPDVQLIEFTREELPGRYRIAPTQPARPLHQGKIERVDEDPSVYLSGAPYPQQLIIVSEGSMGGYRLAGLLIRPVQYSPAEGTIHFYSEMTVRIRWDEAKSPIQETVARKESFGRFLDDHVLNPEDLRRYSPPTAALDRDDEYDYVIITSPSYVSSFEPLAEWKTRKGLKAKIVTTTWIYANFSGVDQSDAVRNFISYAREEWGATWILLGGDTNVVPHRMAYIFDAGLEPAYDTVLCDLYYSDLDSTWDGDGDGVYGERTDGVDMYPDVWVGRASVNTIAECNTFVSKVFTYTKNPPLYQTKELLASSYVFTDNWGEYGNDSIAAKSPDGYTISKMYHSQGELYASAMLDSIEQGYHFIQHTAHCGVNCATTGPDYVWNWDLDALTNGDYLPIYLISGCLASSFEKDCYAEHWINNPNGGGIAACMNSGIAWASDSGVLAFSEGISVTFYDLLFNHSPSRIGEIVGQAKAMYAGDAHSDTIWRMTIYEWNLAGDPELVVWTDTPDTFSVVHDPTIQAGDTTQFSIAVLDNDQVTPIDSAFVCCMCETDSTVYFRGFTDGTGAFTFELAPDIAPDTMFVTVTKHNYLPYESAVPILPVQLDQFIRADANSDSEIAMSDAILTLRYLYVPGADSLQCEDAGDSDDNGAVEMSDAVYTLRYLYVPGALEPPLPGPTDCGPDPTEDDLDCGDHPCNGRR